MTVSASVISQANAPGDAPVISDLGANTSARLSAAAVAALIESGKDIIFNKGILSVIFSAAALKAAGLEAGFTFSATPTTALNISSLTEGLPVGVTPFPETIFDLIVLSGGNPVTDFSQPLELTYNLASQNWSSAQKAKATGARFLGEGELNLLGGSWSENNISVFTSKLSAYGVVLSDNLTAIQAKIGSAELIVNGGTKTMDVAPFIDAASGSTLVPIRFIAEALGASVDWDGETATVTIALDGQTLTLQIGRLDEGMLVAPVIRDDRTFVPLRYVSETLGCNVIWTEDTQEIDIYR
jgi:hypothetical protein